MAHKLPQRRLQAPLDDQRLPERRCSMQQALFVARRWMPRGQVLPRCQRRSQERLEPASAATTSVLAARIQG